jgi:hypothetical protein
MVHGEQLAVVQNEKPAVRAQTTPQNDLVRRTQSMAHFAGSQMCSTSAINWILMWLLLDLMQAINNLREVQSMDPDKLPVGLFIDLFECTNHSP